MSLLYPDLGDTCTAPKCGKFDWLSSKCRLCGDVTCGDHISPESHNCRVLQDTKCLRCGEVIEISENNEIDEALPKHLEVCKAGPTATIPTNKLCSKKGCSKRELIAITCPYCDRNHCITHRLPTDHGCQPESLAPTSSQTGTHMSEQEAKKPFYLWAYSNTTDNMGTRNIPEDQRLGLRVFFAPDLCVRPMYLCASKNWPVGKVLDLACSETGIRNTNNVVGGDDEKLGVFLLSGKCEGLPLSKRLSDLSVAGFQTGSAIMIQRGTSLPYRIVNDVPRWYHFLRFRTKAIDTSSPTSFFDRLDIESNSVVRKVSDEFLKIPLELRICGLYAIFLLFLGRLNPY
eukprot:TRINITY_DN9667_c0_g1_i2.p1 TRINITY_DN9667_c0_g1~~TRINITY_DN9667_c0_g1_i2.p1  ORF type:complete len:358 (+),score=52.73 TRINITY_DN9667_c0_g1_i2:43-1074(+)